MVAVEVEAGQLPPQDSLVELEERHLVLVAVEVEEVLYLPQQGLAAMEAQAHPASW
jgi:hypothetical protein